MGFFEELKRRNVVRVGIAYVVSAWLLLQLTEVLYELLELPVWAPRLIILLLLIGFIPALIFAWVFEMTDQGIKREKDVDRSQSISHRTGRKLDRAIIVALTLALTYFVAERFWPDAEPVGDATTSQEASAAAAESDTQPPDSKPDDKSIAVLPFANRSPNPDDAFFADGVHDDLLTHLSKIGDLHVISRTSVMSYAGTSKNISDIGRELGVATIMEGAVQRAGDRVRINVQLIDAETDAHLWAEIYDRELTADTVFDIQSEITVAIAEALNAILSEADQQELQKRPTENLAAYDSYMIGRLLSGRSFVGDNALLEAVERFDRAIALDPDFAEAYAFRAFAQVAIHWYTATGGDWLAEAAESLRMAEALAPNAVETLTARGYYHYWGFLDFKPADAAFDRALEQAPNFIEAVAGKAFVARRDGRFDEALAWLKSGRRLDPLNADMHSSIVETLSGMGRTTEALAAYESARGSDKDLFDPAIIGQAWEHAGNADKAWQAVSQVPPRNAASFYSFLVYYARLTRNPEAIRQSLDSWPEELRRPIHAPEAYDLMRAQSLLILGEVEAANESLQAIKERIEAADDPYPERWQSNALYLPVELPGLMGDLDGVKAAIADYENNGVRDAWADQEFLHKFARALLLAGDTDAAFDQIDRMVEVRAPWVYLKLSIDPFFEGVKDHPRWIALKAAYEESAAE